ncbi:anti-anti-sigma factor [Chromobacterium sp. ATCC 53434]|uniref:STAS domain-containing protein n=1 Tax=Chromobacterium TaxID=535 RepID=UPI000C767117|nr:STAS domain-containing protein [Chromobacterium sp. ATCC 53434]AUH50103.1 anti-anti-sigma factor [Chromobacterium sp. ATCC 53434]
MKPTIQFDGDIGIMMLIGPFDFNLHREFRQASQELLENEVVKDVRIDFEQVPSLDSSALGMLLLFRERLVGAKKTSLTLTNCKPEVKQAFEAVGLFREFNFQPI